MAVSSEPDQQSPPQQIGHTVAEISEKASLLVREEIELAKAEVSQKAKALGKGAVVALLGGIFGVLGLIFLLHTLAWFFVWLLDSEIFWGFLITTGILFFFAIMAALLGLRWIKKGAPPTPDMAIDEAKRIKETVTS
ncbi:MAG TPA: phage holin family protein [Solirubrobacteraceae bacterium]|nr:phage holin family protein [Solirubrobacteraceae bacterium]